MVKTALFCCLFLSCSGAGLLAQDLFTSPATDHAPDDTYLPLTLGQNYLWTLHEMSGPGVLTMVGISAAVDHSKNNPVKWGHGAEGFADRLGSRFGIVAVRENTAFAIRAIDHEDPRYSRAGSGSLVKRTGYALGQTFVARNIRGGNMPAYSVVASSLATPFIAEAWRPEAVNGGRELRAGVMGIGAKAISNVFQEFWPDVRHKLGK